MSGIGDLPTQALAVSIPGTFWEWWVGLLAAIPVLGMAVSRSTRLWASDRKERVSDDARSDVVQGLLAELDRLRRLNAELVVEFELAQTRIVKIAGENQRLQVELEELHSTVARMILRHSTQGDQP